jgi:hypothetical protein
MDFEQAKKILQLTDTPRQVPWSLATKTGRLRYTALAEQLPE